VITAREQRYSMIEDCCSYVVIQTFAAFVKTMHFSYYKGQLLYSLKINILNIMDVLVKNLTFCYRLVLLLKYFNKA